jgi:hypothetical protein
MVNMVMIWGHHDLGRVENRLIAPYVRIDVAWGKTGKWGEREEKASESTTNGRV